MTSKVGTGISLRSALRQEQACAESLEGHPVQPSLQRLFAGAVFTFITSLEEFNLTFVIGTPTFQTIPTVLFDYLGYHFVRTNAAVVSIILMVPSVALLFIAERFLKTEYLSSAFGKL